MWSSTFNFASLCILILQTSPGVMTQPVSSLGPQHDSVRHTAPSHRFGNRYVSDNDMGKEARPGPGSYEVPQAVGKQTLSPNPSLPSWRIGTGNRFSTYKSVWRTDMQTPGAGEWRCVGQREERQGQGCMRGRAGC